MDKEIRQVIVIGGGASGLAAALAAAKHLGPGRVTVLERLDRVGKKILATGNGRCNLENQTASPADYHSSDPASLAQMAGNCSPAEILDFFEELGLLCSTEEDGRVYPYCYQAAMVLDILRAALERRGVITECGCQVTSVKREKGCFALETKDGRRFFARRVILAAGGQASPQFGTDGGGFALAKAFGHRVEKPYPCLVSLRCKAFPAGLKGLRAECALSLYLDGKRAKTEEGEVLFAEYGLSGIPAMQLSCLLRPGHGEAAAGVDFFPNLSFHELRTFLERRKKSGDFPTLEQFLLGLIGKRLGYAVLRSCGLQPLSRETVSLTKPELSALVSTLKDWRFPLDGTLGWNQAQVTGGGVALSEVEPVTCESKKQKGLYLTGELLDAAGDCGGFNLHWAWSTGLSAGKAAAQNL